jgi:hypothetical protein
MTKGCGCWLEQLGWSAKNIEARVIAYATVVLE